MCTNTNQTPVSYSFAGYLKNTGSVITKESDLFPKRGRIELAGANV